jgi:hypothetical protein
LREEFQKREKGDVNRLGWEERIDPRWDNR